MTGRDDPSEQDPPHPYVIINSPPSHRCPLVLWSLQGSGPTGFLSPCVPV